MDKSKPFGLIITKKAQSYKPTTSAIFGSDSDEESAPKRKMPSIPQAKPKKRIAPEIEEDPSIYEYDNIYDDMKAQEIAKVAPKDSNKPSRYIESLLKAADKRKKDHERRVEKKVQIERESEGDKFKDKEAFVTSSYKKKMEEMEAEEERERRENMLNEMMDVTKQKDLSGFYRHFLKQSVGEEKVPVFGERHAAAVKREEEPAIKQEILSDEENSLKTAQSQSREDITSSISKSKKADNNQSRNNDKGHRREASPFKDDEEEKTTKRVEEEAFANLDRDTDIESSSDEEKDVHSSSNLEKSPLKSSRSKKRKTSIDEESASDAESNSKNKKLKITKSSSKDKSVEDNPDRDTDIDSSSDDEIPEIPSNKNQTEVSVRRDSVNVTEKDVAGTSSSKTKKSEDTSKPSRNIRKRTKDASSSESEDDSARESDIEPEENGASEEKPEIVEKAKVEPPKPKIDIYKKRTVGDVFADAQARYFQRMAARST